MLAGLIRGSLVRSAIAQMASPKSAPIVDNPGRDHSAAGASLGAARMEYAAGRRLNWIGKGKPETSIGDAEARLWRQNRIEQRARVWTARRAEKGVTLSHLNDAAEIHHGNPRSHVLDDCEIVADEHIG